MIYFLIKHLHPHQTSAEETLVKHADAHDTARSVQDETGNTEFNGNRNPEWWGDFFS